MVKRMPDNLDRDPEDIVQIIPATGWHARYDYDDDEELTPLIAWGLTRAGDVIGLDTDSYGWVDVCKEADNFRGYAYRPTWTVGAVMASILGFPSRFGKRAWRVATQCARGQGVDGGGDGQPRSDVQSHLNPRRRTEPGTGM